MTQRRKSKYQKEGAAEMARILSENPDRETMHLWYLTENADSAARRAGMKRSELYESIYGYEWLLPPGARCGQVGTAGNSMYSVFNPFYTGERTAGTVSIVPGPFDIGTDANMRF